MRRLRRGLADASPGGAEHDAGQFDAQLVGQLAAFAQQFQGDRMRDAALLFDEHPDVR